MASAAVPNSATPRPGLPRTIGLLNLISGGLLLLCGLGLMNLLVTPLKNNPGFRIDSQSWEQGIETSRQQLLGELRSREAAASTDAEKAKIRAEREELEGEAGRNGNRIDTAQANKALRGLWVYLWVDVVTGPILNLLMVVAGIGLILLQGWARVLGLWVAVLKIVRLVALCVFATVFVLPNLTRVADDVLRTKVGRAAFAKSMEEQQAQQGNAGAGPQYTPEDVVQILKAFGLVSIVMFTCVGVIYPAIALVVLTRPGARSACASGGEESPWPEGSF